MEQTLVILKPDTVKRHLIGQVVSRIENKGFTIVQMKMEMLKPEVLKQHYAHIADKPFYPEIEEFMTSGPVVLMVVEGENVIEGIRRLMGPTQWSSALPGTIRGDFGTSTGHNLIHGSDVPETAAVEIKRFFPEI